MTTFRTGHPVKLPGHPLIGAQLFMLPGPDAPRGPNLVAIESPYAGDVDWNELYARAALRDSLRKDEAPYASHLLYTQPGVLVDTDEKERAQGIAAGQAWHDACDLSAFYIDLGFSKGMLYGLDRARAAERTAELRTLQGWYARQAGSSLKPLPPDANQDSTLALTVHFRNGNDNLRFWTLPPEFLTYSRAPIKGSTADTAMELINAVRAQAPNVKVWTMVTIVGSEMFTSRMSIIACTPEQIEHTMVPPPELLANLEKKPDSYFWPVKLVQDEEEPEPPRAA